MAHKDGMKPYKHQLVKGADVVCYKDGGRVYAIDKFGEVISSGVETTDDEVVVQAGIDSLPGSPAEGVIVLLGSFTWTGDPPDWEDCTVISKDGIAIIGSIDVDNLKVDTVTEHTSDNGVVIEGILLKDSAVDTNVAAAGVTLSGTTLQADGTDDNIDINITPKGTGEVNLPKVDIDAGTIDGSTIATSDITVGAGKTLDVSAGTLTLADDQISGDKVEGGTINATTITTLTSTTVNATTLDTNVAAAGVTLSGTTLQADGTDDDISITLSPKGDGFVKGTLGAYDAMVFIKGTTVYAVDGENNVIASGVAGTDDTTVIQAAVNFVGFFGSGIVNIKDENYVISSQINVNAGIMILAGNSNFDLTSINTDAFAFNSGGSLVSGKITGVVGGKFTGAVLNTTTYVCSFDRVGGGVIFRDAIVNTANALRLIGECYLADVDNIKCTNITGACIQTERGGVATWGSNGSVFRHIYIEGGQAGSIGFNFLAGENHVRDCYLEALPSYIVINLLDSSGGPWVDITGCKFGLRSVDCTVITYITSGGSEHACSVKNCQFRSSSNDNTIFKLNGSYGYRIVISENEFSIATNTKIVDVTSTGTILFYSNHVYLSVTNNYPLFLFNGPYNRIIGNNILWNTGSGSIIKINAASEENEINNNTFISNTDYINFIDNSSGSNITNSRITNNGFLRITNFKNFGSGVNISGNSIRGVSSVIFSSPGIFSNNFLPEPNKLSLTDAGSMVKDNTNLLVVSEIRDVIASTLEMFGSARLLIPCITANGTTIVDYTCLLNSMTAPTHVGSWFGIQRRATYYDFDGTSHYLYRANDTDFDFGNSTTDSAFTVVCCLNPDAVASRFLIGKWDANNAREWRLFLDASGYPTLQLYDESVDKYIGRVDSASIGTGTWKVLVATYDGSGICAGCKLYIDGTQVDDADYTDAGYVAMEAVSANLMVGALKNSGSYSEYYDGKMTWIGIAAKELSADEVWSLTQRLKGVLGV